MFPPVIDPAMHHSIFSTVTSAVATAMAGAQTKHDKEMLALYEMIKISLLFRESGSSISPPDLAKLPCRRTSHQKPLKSGIKQILAISTRISIKRMKRAREYLWAKTFITGT